LKTSRHDQIWLCLFCYEKIKKSIPRNYLLFGALQRMGLVEKAGTGILRIKQAMDEYKLEHPTFETDENWFTIIFKRPDLEKESYEGRNEFATQKSSQKILKLMVQNPQITINELAEDIGISDRAVKKNIKVLKEKGLLRRVGPAKGGYWQVIE